MRTSSCLLLRADHNRIVYPFIPFAEREVSVPGECAGFNCVQFGHAAWSLL